MSEQTPPAAGLPARRVLIVGGGIAGLSTAIALGQIGVETTVLENATGSVGASIGFSYGCVYALQELGILDQVMASGHTIGKGDLPFWEAVYKPDGERLPVKTPPLREDWPLPSSVLIFRPLLSEIMLATARKHGAEILLGHTYRSLEQYQGGVSAELTSGERREFDLVVAADGVNSELRERFFPEFAEAHYTGSMSFRMMFDDAPDDWRAGLHVANGNTIATAMLPGHLFYLALPNHMERRHIDQDEAREIVLSVLEDYRPSAMFDSIRQRLNDEIYFIVAPYEWIFVAPPWHRGRIVLSGDAAHATAPTIGSAGGMAMEDGVVLAQELAKTDDLDAALTAYALRREERTRLVVETSAELMHTHQLHRPLHEEQKLRTDALEKLIEPY